MTKWPDGVWPPVQEAGSARLDAQGGEARPPRGPPEGRRGAAPPGRPDPLPFRLRGLPAPLGPSPPGLLFLFSFPYFAYRISQGEKRKKQTGSSYFLPLPSRLDKNAK